MKTLTRFHFDHSDMDEERKYEELYRESVTYDDYIEKVIELGWDVEEAQEMWDELNYKYAH